MTQRVLNLSGAFAMATLLAACSSNPDESNPVSGGAAALDTAFGIPADDVPLEGVPDNIAMNVNALEFDADAGTLSIAIDGLDAGTETTSYARNEALDINGYAAFTRQDDALDRFFLALADESPDGTVKSASVTDGGQFNTYFGGAQFVRIGEYSQPTSGLVSYAGSYAGSANGGDRVDTLPLPAGFVDNGTGLAPNQPFIITGQVFLNVDFADDQLNGEIFNRNLLRNSLDADGNNEILKALPNMVLVPTDIAADGTFSGEVEFPGTRQSAGEFAGTFGGNGATAVAAGVFLDNFDTDLDNEEEYGSFALGRCGTAGDSALCDGLGD